MLPERLAAGDPCPAGDGPLAFTTDSATLFIENAGSLNNPMRSSKLPIVALCHLLFIVHLPGEHLTIVAGDYPPFCLEVVLDGTTPVKKGMFIDFMNEFAAQHPRYTFDIVAVPRKRMDAMMNDGEAQVFSLNNPMFVTRNQAAYIWSDPIWHTVDTVVMVKGREFNFEKPEDLIGKTIGKLAGNGYGDYDRLFATGKIKAADVNSFASILNMALAGRTDAFFGNVQTLPYLIERESLPASQFTFSSKPIFEFDLRMQINRKFRKFRRDVNRFIAESRSSGLLQRLEAKYRR